MRKSCDDCPCLEINKGMPFCFWYQGYVLEKNGCANDFKEKPPLNQIEHEAFAVTPLRRNITLREKK